MDLREYAKTETLALVDRIVGNAEAAAQKARAHAEHEIASIRAQADALQSEVEVHAARAAALEAELEASAARAAGLDADLETQAERAASLEADLDAVIEAHRQVDKERAVAEAAGEREAAGRLRAEEELRHTSELLEQARAEIARLTSALEDETTMKALLEEELAGAKDTASTLEAARQATEIQVRLATEAIATLEARLTSEQQARAEAAAEIDLLHARSSSLAEELEDVRAGHAALEAARAEETAARARAEEELRSFQELLDASHKHHEEQADTIRQLEARADEAESIVPSMLSATVRAIGILDASATIAELFGTLVKQVASELPRVALFRVKDSHVVGEHAAGLDSGVDIAKLMIPMTVDSIITRAVPNGGVVRADGAQLAETFRPFSGTAESAIAVPVRFQGETLAVLYAEADTIATQAQATFALLLAGYSGVLLSRLAQELKALKELRDYAGMLLQEAEQMFVSDTQADRPSSECIRRLRETIECGRQLYAQRAALEGTVAAGLLDEQIAAIVSGKSSAFASALAAAVSDIPEAHRNAS